MTRNAGLKWTQVFQNDFKIKTMEFFSIFFTIIIDLEKSVKGKLTGHRCNSLGEKRWSNVWSLESITGVDCEKYD